ncbi:MAG: hypothetical protein WB988_21935 [Candidatus Nitrosopolaris sp.]
MRRILDILIWEGRIGAAGYPTVNFPWIEVEEGVYAWQQHVIIGSCFNIPHSINPSSLYFKSIQSRNGSR